ncbi:MAG: phospholipid carrier-dependent glycosyltransferase [Candidatus Korobacteraceae bacterium]|jgi:4-amino-4-deoxy-L-arabinose transferase-like glycosyltransferase
MTTGTTPETETTALLDPAAAGADLEHAAPASKNWLEWAVLAALAVAMLAQLWTSVVQLSITSDEVDHLHAAYRYWQCNDFGWNPEHPPLVKIVAGLPLQFMHINDPFPHACGAQNSKVIDFLAGHQFTFANPESMLTAARFAVSLFSIVLLLTTWFFTRKMFGSTTAMIAGVLVAFEPTILAHGALVTTDIAASAGILLTLYALYCYITGPNTTRILALGLALGFALCAKHSTVLLAVMLPAVLLADALFPRRPELGRRLLRYAGAVVAAGAIGYVALWGCYGFRYAARPYGAAVWSPPWLEHAHGKFATGVIPQLRQWHVFPEAYLVGLQDVLVCSELGRPTFLLGKLYRSGTWLYFPVSASIKFTLPLLLMVLVSALAVRFWKTRRRELLCLVLPASIYLLFSISSRLNMGIRHLMPVLPLLIIFASAGVWDIARRRRWATVALGVLLTFHITSSLRAYPNYLSYANEAWGGPGETYKYLANSDVDWGQAQKMARAYIDKTHPANCFFLRTYNNKNSDYGIPCQGVSEIQWDALQTPYTGTMIVSSSMVNGIGVRGASVQTRRSFSGLKPVAKLGGSALLVYEGTFDVSPLVAAQVLVRARLAGEQDPEAALTLAQQASALDPASGDAHAVMCGAYRGIGQAAQAQQECDTALALVRKDPQYGPEQVKYLKDFILRNGLQVRDTN